MKTRMMSFDSFCSRPNATRLQRSNNSPETGYSIPFSHQYINLSLPVSTSVNTNSNSTSNTSTELCIMRIICISFSTPFSSSTFSISTYTVSIQMMLWFKHPLTNSNSALPRFYQAHNRGHWPSRSYVSMSSFSTYSTASPVAISIWLPSVNTTPGININSVRVQTRAGPHYKLKASYFDS